MIDISRLKILDSEGRVVKKDNEIEKYLTEREMDFVLVCFDGAKSVNDIIKRISKRDVDKGKTVEGVDSISREYVAGLRRNLRIMFGDDIVPIGKVGKRK